MLSLSLHLWALYAHLAAVLLFFLAHGPSVFVAFALRGERDAARVRTLLDLSWLTVGGLHMAMFLLLGTGLWLAWLGPWWTAAWLWAGLGLLVALWAVMHALGTRHYDKLRAAAGTKQFYPKKGAPLPTPDPEALTRLLASPRPVLLAALGLGGLFALLWLMMFKPSL